MGWEVKKPLAESCVCVYGGEGGGTGKHTYPSRPKIFFNFHEVFPKKNGPKQYVWRPPLGAGSPSGKTQDEPPKKTDMGDPHWGQFSPWRSNVGE